MHGKQLLLCSLAIPLGAWEASEQCETQREHWNIMETVVQDCLACLQIPIPVFSRVGLRIGWDYELGFSSTTVLVFYHHMGKKPTKFKSHQNSYCICCTFLTNLTQVSGLWNHFSLKKKKNCIIKFVVFMYANVVAKVSPVCVLLESLFNLV